MKSKEKKKSNPQTVKLMAKRKELMRKIQEMDPDREKVLIEKMRDKADDILKQVKEMGGISLDDAYTIALCH